MKRFAVLVLVLLLLPALTVMAGGGQEAKTKAVTLKIWDQWTDEHTEEAISQIHAGFSRMYPGIKLERSGMPAQEIADLLKPALTSGTGPDIFYSEVGVGFLGPMLKAGAIMDLSNAWKQRGWDDKLFAMAKEIPSTGGGKVHGVGHELEFVPVYYNKDMMRQTGLAPPKTIADLDKIAAKAKAEGLIPFAWGGRDWWPQANLTTCVLWSYLSKDRIIKGMYQDGTWRYPETEGAIQKAFVDWVKKGYYPPSAEALNYDEMNMVFFQQKAPMHFTGSWLIGEYDANIGDAFEVGSFLWPPAKAGQTANTVSFCGSGYVVSATTANPEAVLDYVDYVMATEEAAKIWYEVAKKIPPYKKEIPGVEIHPLVQENLDALFAGNVQLVPGLSMTVPPEVMTFLQTSAVRVITGQLTPKGWVDEFQKLWDKGKAEKLTLGTFSW